MDGFDLLAIGIAALGLVLLVILVARAIGLLRRFNRVASMVLSATGDRAGLLRARAAAVRVAIGQRRVQAASYDRQLSEEEGGHR